VPQLTALDAVDALTVKGRAPLTGYSRAAFGPAWTDVDRNGCDTRNDILARDLVRLRMSGDCKVLRGVLAPEPYTGRVNVFTYGQSTVDIDHVVALGDAWQKGAFAWTIARRTVFANDPLNLLAVDYSAEGRQRRRHLAAVEQGVPLPVRGAATCREAQVPGVGDAGREARDPAGPAQLPRRAAPALTAVDSYRPERERMHP
jgi:hypothetical protein